jgi:REP element-mobilizing transposase RayT
MTFYSGRGGTLDPHSKKQGSCGSPDPHSKRMKYSEGYHFITIVTNKRVEVFKYKDTGLIAINTMLFYEKRGDFSLKGYIIMPDHIHMICEFLGSFRLPSPPEVTQTGSGRSPDLPDIIRDIKKYISKETIHVLKTLDEDMLLTIRLSRQKKRRHTYQLWQPDYYDFNILTESKLNEKLKYMYENPLRKGLCDNPFDYEFSDVKRYFGSGDPKLPRLWDDSVE